MVFAAVLAASIVQLPSSVVNGRFFYQPVVGGRRLTIWLDTDGSGFVAQRAVELLKLLPIGRDTRLPSGVVQPTANGGLLPIVATDPSDAIFTSIDAQLGATWFAGRIVRMDYRRARLSLLPPASKPAGSLGRAPMRFATGPDGRRIDGKQYPTVDAAIAGGTYAMSFDTAATVAIGGAVRATSFLKSDVLEAWHAAHPRWPYVARAGDAGVAMLRVPSVTIGTYRARNVWFSTRPNDDVFEGERVAGKIGPTAFSTVSVTLDYPGGVVYFDA